MCKCLCFCISLCRERERKREYVPVPPMRGLIDFYVQQSYQCTGLLSEHSQTVRWSGADSFARCDWWQNCQVPGQLQLLPHQGEYVCERGIYCNCVCPFCCQTSTAQILTNASSSRESILLTCVKREGVGAFLCLKGCL